MIYLTRLVVGVYCALFLVPLVASVEANAKEISVVYIGVPNSSAHLGARQGLSEANAQGEFMGIEYRLISVNEIGESGSVPVAVIAAVNSADLLELLSEYRNLPLFNTTENSTTLREECRDNLFHVGPSAAMLADAERQWQRHAPGSSAHASAWHRTFKKYAAAQLNMRFEENFHVAMDDDAWAGWAAMKLLADTIVRQPGLVGESLITELKTNLAFDGQKGTDMSFRETGQLRQPVLLIEADKIVGEAPVRGVVNTSNLDSLGVLFCPK